MQYFFAKLQDIQVELIGEGQPRSVTYHLDRWISMNAEAGLRQSNGAAKLPNT